MGRRPPMVLADFDTFGKTVLRPAKHLLELFWAE